MRLIKETNLPIVKQIECLVNDIQQLNYDLENKCNIKNGFSQFLEKQSDFTKEILDAYITSIDLSKENINKFFTNKSIEQKRAYYDLGKSIDLPKNITKEDDNDLFENYENERVLNITQLDWATAPENIPLPDDSEDEFNELNKNQLFMETVADIHASMVGDQNRAGTENISLASGGKDSGECKVPRPVPDPEPLKKLETIETIKDEKTKRGLKTRFRSFFTRTPNRSQTAVTS